ncbi:MAG: ABC transporter permease [Clostridium sp.]
MSKVLILMKYNFKKIVLKGPIAFLMQIIVPVIIALVFMNISFSSFTSSTKIGIVDNDKSTVSNYIISLLESNESYDVSYYDSTDETSLEKNKLTLFIEFDKGFEETLDLKTTALDTKEESIEGIKLLLKNEVNNIAMIKNGCGDNNELFKEEVDSLLNEGIDINKVTKDSDAGKLMAAQMLIAQIGFLMFINGISAAEVFFYDRKINIFTRLFTMPIKTSYYYLAALLSNMLILLLQGYSTLILSKVLLDVDFGMPLWKAFLIVTIFATVIVSFVQLIVTLSKTEQEVGSLSMNICMVFAIIGGSFVPVQIFPDLLNKVSYISPSRWLIEYVTQAQSGNGIVSEMIPVAILILFAAVIFLLSVYLSKRNEKSYN